MNGKSMDIKQNDIETLRELFPYIFSEDKIDLKKFQIAFNYDVDSANERYTLNWAGKSDAFKILQEGTTATLKPQPELSVNFNATENAFIEGENLEVLKILQKSYYNKIKCIIIDPPYNTGSDSFIYPDRFKENLEDYEKRVGERDEEGYLMKEGLFRKNSRENGHYHSNWLNMMLPRLFLARNLLRDDGVIFVHIDDNEVHNLRLLMNEIFGEENFVACVSWHKNYASANDSKTFSNVLDYILIYQKSEKFERNLLPRTEKQNSLYKYDSNDGKGLWRSDNLSVKTYSIEYDYPIFNPNTGIAYHLPKGRCWLTNKNTIQEWIKEGRIFFGQTGNGAPQLKRYLNEVQQGVVPITYWSYEDCGHNDEARKEIKLLFENPPFDTPKPTRLIKKITQIGADKDSIILDFFAGSATTAHAVLDLNKEDNGNRKFILVQLPELCNEDSEAYKAGYKTIADISRERIRRVIQKIGNGGFKAYKLSPSNFKIWRSEEITEENLEKQMEMFIDPVKPESLVENMLVELMLKSGYQLTDKVENRGDFYYINNELVIALTKMDLEIAAKIIALQPQKVITLDRLFAGNDELKTNTALQMRDAGVELRVV